MLFRYTSTQARLSAKAPPQQPSKVKSLWVRSSIQNLGTGSPRLMPEEREQLKKSICSEGCRDAIIVWEDENGNIVVVGGHERLEICLGRIKIPYKTALMKFPDREAALEWIDATHLGRRNLTPDGKRLLIGRLYELSKKQGQRNDLTSPQTAEKLPAERIADQQGVSKGTVERAAKAYRLIADDPEAQRAILQGEKKFADVIFHNKKRDKIVAALEDLKMKETKEILGLYDVIVIDPPWSRKATQGEITPEEVRFNYLTMPLEEIKALKLHCDNCHVFIWTTQSFLFDMPDLLEAWGLTRRCMLIWHKDAGAQPTGLPRYNYEPIIYATKGSPSFVEWKAFDACFSAPCTQHSAKPEAFYETLRRVTAGRRLDMFGRRKIEGFDSWGNEAPD